MNLSDILKEENPTVRHVLLGNWKQDQDWKEKMEQRGRDLEPQKQHVGIRVKVGERLLETSFKKVT